MTRSFRTLRDSEARLKLKEAIQSRDIPTILAAIEQGKATPPCLGPAIVSRTVVTRTTDVHDGNVT